MFVTTANDTMFEVNPLYLHRLTVHDIRRMLEAGVLRDGDPIELIEGVLIRKDRSDTGGTAMTQGERHAEIVERLLDLIPRIKSLGFRCRSQLPIYLSDASAPEPDLVVYRQRAKPLKATHPRAEDIVAVIEVSDSSLKFDHTTKHRIYALAAIPTYWIVNIPERKVESYRSPDSVLGQYTQHTDFSPGETMQLDLGDGQLLDVPVAEIFG